MATRESSRLDEYIIRRQRHRMISVFVKFISYCWIFEVGPFLRRASSRVGRAITIVARGTPRIGRKT